MRGANSVYVHILGANERPFEESKYCHANPCGYQDRDNADKPDGEVLHGRDIFPPVIFLLELGKNSNECPKNH
jgi:hypothetical protein